MLDEVEAVYENGVLRPLAPLPLAEQEHVKLTVLRIADSDWLDVEFMEACGRDADPSLSLEVVRASLAKIGGSMDAAIEADRGEY
jgi:predicted DNA-binding antitoxin AbrB/MazE fold protein